MAITFYQTERRDPSQVYSNDQYQVSLSELVRGCVPDYDKFLVEFINSEAYTTYFDYGGLDALYEGKDFDITPIEDRNIVDYLIDIKGAFYILWNLFFTDKDIDFKDKIDGRIQELSDAIGPRTGEHVIKSY